MSQKFDANALGINGAEIRRISFWCRLGPFFLFGLSTVAFFKTFSYDFFFLILSYIGVFFIWKWMARVVSTALLVGVLLTSIYITQELFWPLFFSGAVGLSWWISVLGEREVAIILCAKEGVLRGVVQHCQNQQEQLEEHLHQLNHACQELSLAEAKLWGFYKEEEEKALFDLEGEISLGDRYQEVEGECQELKIQVDLLQECITEMLSEQKIPRLRKPRARVHEDGVLPIPF